jgi:hypothetical protein
MCGRAFTWVHITDEIPLDFCATEKNPDFSQKIGV